VTFCGDTGHFLHGAEKTKRAVNVYLHCFVSNLERISQMSMLAPLEKFLWTPMMTSIILLKSLVLALLSFYSKIVFEY